MFWVYVVVGFIAGIDDGAGNGGIFDIGWNDNFGEFLSWMLLGAVTGFVQLVINMLVIQLLNNVQIIREKMEKMEDMEVEKRRMY